jgi:2-polyprenyl-6-methoxyphenol hydroxylase-like FAD-dependent oxidoreductase
MSGHLSEMARMPVTAAGLCRGVVDADRLAEALAAVHHAVPHGVDGALAEG